MRENQYTELVLIPGSIIGHLKPAMQMANFLITREKNISITVLVMKVPMHIDMKLNTYIQSLPPHPRIKLMELIQEDESVLELLKRPFGALSAPFMEGHKDQVKNVVGEIMSKSRLGGIIIDWVCSTTMMEVANEFGVANYIFYTSGAATIGIHLHLLRLRNDHNIDITSYRDADLETEFSISTFVNPFPVKCLPHIILDSKEGATIFMNLTINLQQTKGILINTFSELESHAFESLNQVHKLPPLYPIGPLLSVQSGNSTSHEEIFKWLDDQPDSSVVFLCFGSLGFFNMEQTREIARALENIGCRFVWSIKGVSTSEESLPEGFLQRTMRIGKVIDWAPQVEVLSHCAIGGFVSHCGWNSIMESIWSGVPMAAWPIYAEQQANAFQLFKDLGVAVEIKMDYRRQMFEQIVKADVIEEAIKKLMEPKNEIRTKAKEMQEKSRATLHEGGTSYEFLGKFIQEVITDSSSD